MPDGSKTRVQRESDAGSGETATDRPGASAPLLRCAWSLDGLDEPVRAARRYVTETLTQWHLTPLSEDAVVVASELVTNACRHAHPPIRLTLSLDTALRPALLIEVGDGDPTPPRPRSPDENGGFGMTVLAGYADITVTTHPDGKTTRARVPLKTPIRAIRQEVV